VFLRFEFSPYEVTVTEKTGTLTQFITQCCAIIGGVWVVMGLLSAFLSSLQAKILLVGNKAGFNNRQR